jgi:hypothetical protein
LLAKRVNNGAEQPGIEVMLDEDPRRSDGDHHRRADRLRRRRDLLAFAHDLRERNVASMPAGARRTTRRLAAIGKPLTKDV